MKIKLLRKNKGLTFIEVIVSLLIFTLSITVIMSGVLYSKSLSLDQEITLRFITITYNISDYFKVYKGSFSEDTWAEKYFGEDYDTYVQSFPEEGTKLYYFVNYDSDLNYSSNLSTYQLRYSYIDEDDGHKTLSVTVLNCIYNSTILDKILIGDTFKTNETGSND